MAHASSFGAHKMFYSLTYASLLYCGSQDGMSLLSDLTMASYVATLKSPLPLEIRRAWKISPCAPGVPLIEAERLCETVPKNFSLSLSNIRSYYQIEAGTSKLLSLFIIYQYY